MEKVAVVIPIYKEVPNENDVFSLKNTAKKLGDFPCFYVYPKDINIEIYQKILPKANFIPLHSKNFKDIKSYNRMLLSPFFYRLFLRYEYILICQTDVYVFDNQLIDWCNKNYDYIGSPWIIKPPQVKKNVLFDLNNWAIGKVGNGGFSLRKTKLFYFLAYFTQILFIFIPKNEDFIWCVIMPKIYPFLKFPKVEEALHFAMELEPSKTYERLGVLPFGVHAWEKYEPEFWKQFFS